MSRATMSPRYIKASSIQIGDTIKVDGMWADTRIERVGIVAKRDHRLGTTEFMTAAGVVLHAVFADNTTDLQSAKITLLSRVGDSDVPPTLFDMLE